MTFKGDIWCGCASLLMLHISGFFDPSGRRLTQRKLLMRLQFDLGILIHGRLPAKETVHDRDKKQGLRVARMRPPITARPSGAFCSPPSPEPSAIGTMPITIAIAVIRTGRMRV